MTCSDVQRALPEILDGNPDGPLATEFETHVQSCPDCSDLVSDLKLITSEARQLAATDEPPPRVWVGIAAQLRAEGLIREPELTSAAARRPMLVPSSPRGRWSAWWLAPVAAVLVAAGAYVMSHKPAQQVAKQQGPATPGTSPAPTLTAPTSGEQSSTATAAPAPAPAPQRPAQKPAPPSDAVASAEEAPPNAEDQQFLSVVSTRAPSMRAAYENQLQAVNADIRETQEYVKRNPRDMDARQHLMDAYQQKALLYQIALDRIQ